MLPRKDSIYQYSQCDRQVTDPEYRIADESGIPVPSRHQIIGYLAEVDQPVSIGELVRHFRIEGESALQAVSARIQRLKRLGVVTQDSHDHMWLPDQHMIVSGVVIGHASGHGFVRPDRGGEDVYLPYQQMLRVLHGDRVLIKVKTVRDDGSDQAMIVEVKVNPDRQFVGYFRQGEKVSFVTPMDQRLTREIRIPADQCRNACPGDLVVVKITQHPVQYREVVGCIQRVLDHEMTPGMETTLAIYRHDIPDEWPQAVQDQLEQERHRWTRASPHRSRRDLRDLPLVTIDGEDARDFDDAVFCRRSRRGWRLVVAIADVGHYVRVNTPLDIEASIRGNSVYFPHRVVPMLPEVLSTDICSLKPDEDRYCMVCDMQVSRIGNILDYEFYPAVIRSRARLTYDEVASVVSDRDSPMRQKWVSVAHELDNLLQLQGVLALQRNHRGAINFEFVEPRLHFNEHQRIQQITQCERHIAHRIIEECMLAANICAGQLIKDHLGGTGIFRNHGGPDSTMLSDLNLFLQEIGLHLSGGDSPEAADFAAVLEKAAERPAIFNTVQTLLLRSLSQAEYACECKGHFALAYPVYTHFTSPIRRYPDLIVHRLISNILTGSKDHAVPDDTSLTQVAAHCSRTERRADEAVRDVISWLKTEYMQDHVGEEYDGVVSAVKKFGLFVQLDSLFVDGLVHVRTLTDDWYDFDPVHHTLTGRQGGGRFKVGDRLRVKVIEADLDLVRVNFALAAKAGPFRRGKPTGHRGRGGRTHAKQNSSEPYGLRRGKRSRPP